MCSSWHTNTWASKRTLQRNGTISKNAQIIFDDIGEYMQGFHTENNMVFVEANRAIAYDFGKEIHDVHLHVDKNYDLIAETMKWLGNSANGKTITKRKGLVETSYSNEKI